MLIMMVVMLLVDYVRDLICFHVVLFYYRRAHGMSFFVGGTGVHGVCTPTHTYMGLRVNQPDQGRSELTTTD